MGRRGAGAQPTWCKSGNGHQPPPSYSAGPAHELQDFPKSSPTFSVCRISLDCCDSPTVPGLPASLHPGGPHSLEKRREGGLPHPLWIALFPISSPQKNMDSALGRASGPQSQTSFQTLHLVLWLPPRCLRRCLCLCGAVRHTGLVCACWIARCVVPCQRASGIWGHRGRVCLAGYVCFCLCKAR